MTLKKAASWCGLPVEELRGAILLGELAAEDSPDLASYTIAQRDLEAYLRHRGVPIPVSPADPPRRKRGRLLGCAALACAILLVGHCLFSKGVSSRCSGCGLYSRSSETLGLTWRRAVEETDLSRRLSELDPRPCSHDWRAYQWNAWGT